LSEGVKASRLAAGLERGVDALVAVSTALVLWHGTMLVLRGALTPGELLVFLSYLKSAFKPVRDFAKYTGRLSRAAAASERVLDLLEQEPEVRDRQGAVPAPPLRGAVHFDGVSFAYVAGYPVVRGLDVEVTPGQRVALVGPSGSGKSTTVGLLLRFYDPDAGCVLVDGRDIREYTLESLRRQISVVLQDTILFAASVRENIGYGTPGVPPDRIEAAARLASAHEFIERLPQGYDTELGERGATLSAGQRQRLAIARAAVREAPILILDEPTIGLDEANETAVTAALERLAAGRTTLLITHDLHRAATADLILYLDQGRVAERGTHGELLKAGGRYAALYRLQAAARRRDLRTGDSTRADSDAVSA
jgi:ATP-binding cassette subfamily B protein